MKVEMVEFSTKEEIHAYGGRWDVALVGGGDDDRLKTSRQYAEFSCNRIVNVNYNPIDMVFIGDGEEYACYEIDKFIKKLEVKRILLDATTLGVSELGLLLKNMKSRKRVRSSILYVEPDEYRKESKKGINERSFQLSKEFHGYRGIPTLSNTLKIEEDNCVVFFLGFEGKRLKIALEDLNINPYECSLFFGVPSFQAGWEINAYENNIKAISEKDLDGRVYFCGANNPAAVIHQLKEIRRDIGDNVKMTLVPIGSKPHSIGALAFTAWDENSHILFDHPIKPSVRSDSVGSFHLYEVQL